VHNDNNQHKRKNILDFNSVLLSGIASRDCNEELVNVFSHSRADSSCFDVLVRILIGKLEKNQ
jgi:hypothetical protein